MKKILSYLVVVLFAVVSAVNYCIFVLPNSFAPSGLNGLCVIIMKLTGLNIGYLSLIINIPLALAVYYKVSRPIAVRSLCYVAVFSVALIVFEKYPLPIRYFTENGTSKILGPLTAGIIMGCIYSVLLRAGAYTGGMDFVAVLINNKYPEKSVFSINFLINIAVAVASFFVFDYEIEPVLLCILYSFASSTMADKAFRAGRSAVRFEVISEDCDAISKEIISTLHHSATIIEARGAYTKESKKVLICIVNRCQVAVFYRIINKYKGTFAVVDPVSEVYGNFKQISGNGKPNAKVLDDGQK